MRQDGLWEYLKWDSEFFALRIARCLPNRLSREIRDLIETTCRAERIDCLYFLADANDPETVRLAEATGFYMVDLRVTLRRATSGQVLDARPKSAGGSVRPVTRADLQDLRSIACHSHRDSRFYFDPHFSALKCDSLYDTWIQRSCRGFSDAVLVAEHEQRPSGYITCKGIGEQIGHIGLFAVDGPAQNMGFGSALVSSALRWFREHGIEEVEVVTQGRNVAAQRCYQRCGFVTHNVQVWYHWWPFRRYDTGRAA